MDCQDLSTFNFFKQPGFHAGLCSVLLIKLSTHGSLVSSVNTATVLTRLNDFVFKIRLVEAIILFPGRPNVPGA